MFSAWVYEGKKRHDDWWLNAPWDKGKYDAYRTAKNIPFYNTYVDNLYAQRSNDEYMRRYHMDYSNIHDPRNLWNQGGTTTYRTPLPVLSANVHQLYRDAGKIYHKKKYRRHEDVMYG